MKLRIDKQEICREVEQIALYYAAKTTDMTTEVVDNVAIIDEDGPMLETFIHEAIAGAVNDMRWLVDVECKEGRLPACDNGEGVSQAGSLPTLWVVLRFRPETGVSYLQARLIESDLRRYIVHMVAARWLALSGHEGAGQCEEIAEEARRRIHSQFMTPWRRRMSII